MGLGMLFRRRGREDLFVFGLFLLFFLPAEVARSKPHPQPERYILPARPFLCIAAAQAVRFLSTAVPKKWISALLVLLIASPLIRSLPLASDLYPDTRAQLVSWTLNHLPAGSKLYLDTLPTYSGRCDRTRMKKNRERDMELPSAGGKSRRRVSRNWSRPASVRGGSWNSPIHTTRSRTRCARCVLD